MTFNIRASLRTAFGATLVIAALTLGGCAQNSSDLSLTIAAELQRDVVLIGDLAASGDTDGALALLDSLETEATHAADDGSISAERLAGIRTAIAVVRTDLQPAPTPAPLPDPAPAPVGQETVMPTEPAGPAPSNSDDSGNTGGEKDKGDKGKDDTHDKNDQGKGNDQSDD
jgi:hypothetical protein